MLDEVMTDKLMTVSVVLPTTVGYGELIYPSMLTSGHSPKL